VYGGYQNKDSHGAGNQADNDPYRSLPFLVGTIRKGNQDACRQNDRCVYQQVPEEFDIHLSTALRRSLKDVSARIVSPLRQFPCQVRYRTESRKITKKVKF
jgi:hypothetical protein